MVVPPGAPLELRLGDAAGEGLSFEAAIDGGLLAPIGGTISAPPEGDHWLTVASRDRNGTLSPLRWIHLRVDSRPPRLEFAIEPEPVSSEAGGHWFVGPGARARARAEDDHSGIEEVSIDGAAEAVRGAGPELVADLPGRGPVELRATARDGVGNLSEPALRQVTVDADPPTGTITLVGPAVSDGDRRVAGPSVRLEASIEDSESGVGTWEPQLDSGSGLQAITEDVWKGPWNEGRYHAAAEAVDRVGNRAVVGRLAFDIDATGPELSWRILSEGVRGDGGEIYYAGAIEVELSATDSPAGVSSLEWSTGSGAWSSLGPGTSTVQVEGDSVTIRSVDRVGNERQEGASWRVDRQAPVVQMKRDDGSLVPSGTLLEVEFGDMVHVWAEDAGVGIESQRILVDEGSWVPLPRVVWHRKRGRYEVRAEATDRLGNRTEVAWPVRVRSAKKGGAR